MLKGASSSPSTGILHQISQCCPETSPTACGRISQLTNSTYLSAICLINTHSSIKSHPSPPCPCPKNTGINCTIQPAQQKLHWQWPPLYFWQFWAISPASTHWPHHVLSPLTLIQWLHQVAGQDAQDHPQHEPNTGTSLEDLLLDLWSTPISPKIPSPRESLHNRMINCPDRPPTQPI